MNLVFQKTNRESYFVAVRDGQPFAEMFKGRARWWTIVYGLAEAVPWEKATEAERFIRDTALWL